MDPYAKTFAQQFQTAEMIALITKDVLPMIAPGGHVIPTTGPLEAQHPGHETMPSAVAHQLNSHLSI